MKTAKLSVVEEEEHKLMEKLKMKKKQLAGGACIGVFLANE